ncbi:OmpA family protein [uncultured Microbulbifer sp.]|uniref:OmpA family protein n=1 Tax=uncultured Microbulbifer sp. TaxID=348147 RepID=UPI002611CD8F|nr:OmpA family protein [uncultured Microbulbifer sp.]
MQLLRSITFYLVTIGAVLHSNSAASAAQDHPLINRFPGSTINKHGFAEYEEVNLLLSTPYKDTKNRKWTADKIKPLAGKVSYLHYEFPKRNTPLQVFRNYQKAIKKQGMEILFNCERVCADVNYGHLDDLINNAQNYYLNYQFNQYIAAKKGNTYLSLVVNKGGVWQFVIEEESLNDDLISPIAKTLSETGRIDLYGFYFDSGKYELKSGSEMELKQLSDVLSQYPELKIRIIGHTDSVGEKYSNQKLSAARADAVSIALQSQYMIDRPRLITAGMGESQPIADNSTETGREKNRRVEVIAINPEVINSGKDYADVSEKQRGRGQEDSEPLLNQAKEKMKKAEDAKDLAKRLKRFF